MKIVATLEQRVPILLDAHQRQVALKAVNLALTGKEVLPFYERVSQHHKDAHYAVCISETITVLIDVYEDGSKRYRMKKYP